MSPETPNTYDELPYVGHAFHFTHPDEIAVMATLFGLQPAPVKRCRVLELGCGDGANILPMAYTLPESEFFGIDLAAKPVAEGHAQAAALGLTNVRLEVMDILDFPADAGQFDYIIAHGVMSWVPAPVQEKIFAICAEHLSPQGIAYLSYKTLPGSHVGAMAHEMMRYEASRLPPDATGTEIVQRGLGLMHLVANAKKDTDAYRVMVSSHLQSLEARVGEPGGYSMIYHDIGVECTQPFYFYELMARAGQHGLQFVTEADFSTAQKTPWSPEAVRFLATLEGDIIAREQYQDFLTFGAFRRSLLCRQELAVERPPSIRRVESLLAASAIRPLAPGAPKPGVEDETFVAAHGAKVTVDRPVLKAAFRHLGAVWPASVAFGELLAGCPPEGVREDDAACLATTLLELHRAGLLELTTRQPVMAVTLSERPVASARVRQQIAHGHDFVTDLRHTELRINEPHVRALLALLDGTRDQAAILRDFQGWLDTARETNPSLPTREWAGEKIDVALLSFVRQSLLVA